jgi:phenylacetate-CoA ligase
MKFRLRDYMQPVKVLRFHRLMNEAPFWEPSRLTDWVGATRRALVKHAVEHVPHYRETLTAANIQLDHLDDEAEWLRIPTISKSLVVGTPERFISSAAPRDAVWTSTSGSTGMPMKILLDPNINAAAFALFWRAWSTGGYWRLGQRHAVMKNHPAAAVVNHNRRLRAMEAVPRRINASTAREVRDAFARYKPRFLRGYPSAMYLFCRLLEEQGLELQIPMVISGSETLYEYHRAKIEAVLKTRVINHYTHWERSASILECERGSLHAQQDFGYHELLDRSGRPVGPGVEGEITVTGLHNTSMPFIRYRTGDIAVWDEEPCACGRSFPVIKHIVGRNSDFLIRRDGAILGGIAIVSFMRQLTDVRYVQIVQSEPGAVTVKVVRAPNYSELTTKRIARDVQQLCENQMEVNIEFCEIEGLERSPVGKIRQYISHVAPGSVPLRVQAS